ncbi:Cyclin-B1-2 [Wickerhamomyces ciferrii]|uniref:Cyclin-B1-2 n=1 Tax=Wickerhamomyces ciferrii (strain ATCC 14091 / BCRC 22168 / CBS 111 / JCM 3599 / NBRC 0793 / NRRL Y-1031 F-60-10) TaxID=1206466 RepID=K0KTK7_WICCF|nr:Cyclin-B1-2 [Wickerhamomyces ciferrii]CCH45352.1 Cyclin-B1-2 [Wickerhamomyces ciferrii]
MSDKEALYQFNKKPVNSEMVQYLVDTTYSVIKIKPSASNSYPSPPSSPNGQDPVSLFEFIRRLIKHSNVQTPTLMSTLVYLTRLRAVLPSNVYGIETTRHRIFLGCLILAAKSLNDSSPINKHWTAYTDGLLSIQEVNTIERELLDYLNWDLTITQQDLYNSLSFFLIPIKAKLKKIAENDLITRQKHYITSTPSSTRLASMVAPRAKPVSNSSSASSVPSLLSNSSSRSTLSSIGTQQSSNSINNMLNQSQPVILEQPEYNYQTKPLRQLTPSKSSNGGYRPLRLRSSNDNNQQIYSNNMNNSQSSNLNYEKSKNMMLAAAGKITRAF